MKRCSKKNITFIRVGFIADGVLLVIMIVDKEHTYLWGWTEEKVVLTLKFYKKHLKAA